MYPFPDKNKFLRIAIVVKGPDDKILKKRGKKSYLIITVRLIIITIIAYVIITSSIMSYYRAGAQGCALFYDKKKYQ